LHLFCIYFFVSKKKRVEEKQKLGKNDGQKPGKNEKNEN